MRGAGEGGGTDRPCGEPACIVVPSAAAIGARVRARGAGPAAARGRGPTARGSADFGAGRPRRALGLLAELLARHVVEHDVEFFELFFAHR